MRIALVAVSAMGAANRESLGPGFDSPAFVARNRTIQSLPSLALLTLAGMASRDHDFQYFEMEDLGPNGELPGKFDLAAISSYTAQIFTAYKLAEQYRAAGIPVVMGGPHVSCLPEEAAQHCDAAVIGEGEPVWLDVLRDCENGRLQKIYGSLRADFDLAESPMPAFELLDVTKYKRLTIETSRGCPHRCTTRATRKSRCRRRNLTRWASIAISSVLFGRASPKTTTRPWKPGMFRRRTAIWRTRPTGWAIR